MCLYLIYSCSLVEFVWAALEKYVIILRCSVCIQCNNFVPIFLQFGVRYPRHIDDNNWNLFLGTKMVWVQISFFYLWKHSKTDPLPSKFSMELKTVFSNLLWGCSWFWSLIERRTVSIHCTGGLPHPLQLLDNKQHTNTKVVRRTPFINFIVNNRVSFKFISSIL